MKEITRVVTAQITQIAKVEDDAVLKTDAEIANDLKRFLNADDVQVVQVQDFIIDQEGCKDEQ